MIFFLDIKENKEIYKVIILDFVIEVGEEYLF